MLPDSVTLPNTGSITSASDTNVTIYSYDTIRNTFYTQFGALIGTENPRFN